MPYDWNGVIKFVRYRLPPHEELEIPANCLPPPENVGFRPSIGMKPGSHYRLPLPDGTGIHIRFYEGRYYIHWDKCDPLTRGILCHLAKDAPYVILAGGAILGALYELFSSNQPGLKDLIRGALKGMGVGLIIQALLELLYSNANSYEY